MAKTVNCAFCGKELKTGLFSGEVFSLSAGDAGTIDCCQACHQHYHLDRQEEKRFAAKLANYKKSNKLRKLTQQELVALYTTYFTEMQTYQAKHAGIKLPESMGLFQLSKEGFFSVTEFALGSLISKGDMIKAIDKLAEEGVCAFQGSDISRLEYRLTDKLGTSIGTCKDAFLFEIYFNDPKELTYKPTVSYFLTRGAALLPHKRRQKAEESLVSLLQVLQQTTGTQAQIRKIK